MMHQNPFNAALSTFIRKNRPLSIELPEISMLFDRLESQKAFLLASDVAEFILDAFKLLYTKHYNFPDETLQQHITSFQTAFQAEFADFPSFLSQLHSKTEQLQTIDRSQAATQIKAINFSEQEKVIIDESIIDIEAISEEKQRELLEYLRAKLLDEANIKGEGQLVKDTNADKPNKSYYYIFTSPKEYEKLYQVLKKYFPNPEEFKLKTTINPMAIGVNIGDYLKTAQALNNAEWRANLKKIDAEPMRTRGVALTASNEELMNLYIKKLRIETGFACRVDVQLSHEILEEKEQGQEKKILIELNISNEYRSNVEESIEKSLRNVVEGKFQTNANGYVVSYDSFTQGLRKLHAQVKLVLEANTSSLIKRFVQRIQVEIANELQRPDLKLAHHNKTIQEEKGKNSYLIKHDEQVVRNKVVEKIARDLAIPTKDIQTLSDGIELSYRPFEQRIIAFYQAGELVVDQKKAEANEELLTILNRFVRKCEIELEYGATPRPDFQLVTRIIDGNYFIGHKAQDEKVAAEIKAKFETIFPPDAIRYRELDGGISGVEVNYNLFITKIKQLQPNQLIPAEEALIKLFVRKMEVDVEFDLPKKGLSKRDAPFRLKASPIGYDLAVMPDDADAKPLKQKQLIEFKCTEEGLQYRVLGGKGEEELIKHTIQWNDKDLPQDFTRTDKEILARKSDLLSAVHAITTRNRHTQLLQLGAGLLPIARGFFIGHEDSDVRTEINTQIQKVCPAIGRYQQGFVQGNQVNVISGRSVEYIPFITGIRNLYQEGSLVINPVHEEINRIKVAMAVVLEHMKQQADSKAEQKEDLFFAANVKDAFVVMHNAYSKLAYIRSGDSEWSATADEFSSRIESSLDSFDGVFREYYQGIVDNLKEQAFQYAEEILQASLKKLPVPETVARLKIVVAKINLIQQKSKQNPEEYEGVDLGLQRTIKYTSRDMLNQIATLGTVLLGKTSEPSMLAEMIINICSTLSVTEAEKDFVEKMTLLSNAIDLLGFEAIDSALPKQIKDLIENNKASLLWQKLLFEKVIIAKESIDFKKLFGEMEKFFTLPEAKKEELQKTIDAVLIDLIEKRKTVFVSDFNKYKDALIKQRKQGQEYKEEQESKEQKELIKFVESRLKDLETIGNTIRAFCESGDKSGLNEQQIQALLKGDLATNTEGALVQLTQFIEKQNCEAILVLKGYPDFDLDRHKLGGVLKKEYYQASSDQYDFAKAVKEYAVDSESLRQMDVYAELTNPDRMLYKGFKLNLAQYSAALENMYEKLQQRTEASSAEGIAELDNAIAGCTAKIQETLNAVNHYINQDLLGAVKKKTQDTVFIRKMENHFWNERNGSYRALSKTNRIISILETYQTTGTTELVKQFEEFSKQYQNMAIKSYQSEDSAHNVVDLNAARSDMMKQVFNWAHTHGFYEGYRDTMLRAYRNKILDGDLKALEKFLQAYLEAHTGEAIDFNQCKLQFKNGKVSVALSQLSEHVSFQPYDEWGGKFSIDHILLSIDQVNQQIKTFITDKFGFTFSNNTTEEKLFTASTSSIPSEAKKAEPVTRIAKDKIRVKLDWDGTTMAGEILHNVMGDIIHATGPTMNSSFPSVLKQFYAACARDPELFSQQNLLSNSAEIREKMYRHLLLHCDPFLEVFYANLSNLNGKGGEEYRISQIQVIVYAMFALLALMQKPQEITQQFQLLNNPVSDVTVRNKAAKAIQALVAGVNLSRAQSSEVTTTDFFKEFAQEFIKERDKKRYQDWDQNRENFNDPAFINDCILDFIAEKNSAAQGQIFCHDPAFADLATRTNTFINQPGLVSLLKGRSANNVSVSVCTFASADVANAYQNITSTRIEDVPLFDNVVGGMPEAGNRRTKIAHYIIDLMEERLKDDCYSYHQIIVDDAERHLLGVAALSIPLEVAFTAEGKVDDDKVRKYLSEQGCDLILMASPSAGHDHQESNKQGLFLYKEEDGSLFYIYEKTKQPLKLNDPDVERLLSKTVFDGTKARFTLCSNLRICEAVLEVTSTKGHTQGAERLVDNLFPTGDTNFSLRSELNQGYIIQELENRQKDQQFIVDAFRKRHPELSSDDIRSKMQDAFKAAPTLSWTCIYADGNNNHQQFERLNSKIASIHQNQQVVQARIVEYSGFFKTRARGLAVAPPSQTVNSSTPAVRRKSNLH